MVLIELYENNPLENIVSTLLLKPEKVIFLKKQSADEAARKREEKKTKQYKKSMKRILDDRHIECLFYFMYYDAGSLASVVELMTQIIQENPGCEFNINGGDEVALLALGIAMGQNPSANIQVHKINYRNRRITDYDDEKDLPELADVRLGVDEIINLYGGQVLFKETDYAAEGTVKYTLDEAFEANVLGLWQLCRGNCGAWNKYTSMLGELENYKILSDDSLTVCAQRAAFDSEIVKTQRTRTSFYNWVQRLADHGYIQSLELTQEQISFRYGSELLENILTKAGTLLELYVYMGLQQLKAQNGFFNDVLTGVQIDWDREFHEDKIYDEVMNEIDVFAMKGTVPVFISCKNGEFDVEELYKLNSVAEHFGDHHSVKILVVSYFTSSPKYQVLHDRAEMMGIHLVEAVQTLSLSDLVNKITYFCR